MIEVLNVSAEVVAAIFGIAVTVVAIIVQLAATRFNHQITAMFIRDPLNIAVQGFFLITTLVCIWIAAVPDIDEQLPYVGIGLVTVALLILLPYFGYVFSFISPLKVINRIGRQAEKAIEAHAPRKILGAIDQLQEVTRNAIEQGDRAIALACVSTFCGLFEHYQLHRNEADDEEFGLEDLHQDLDFVSFEPGALLAMAKSHLWFESKILQQFLNIMRLTAPAMHDVAASVGIAVQRIAIKYSDRDEIVSVALRAMNSFLRASLNARDARTSYHLFSQYRGIIEVLLKKPDTQTALAAAEHLTGYGRLAFATNQPFILEVAAFDMATLIRYAHKHSKDALPGLIAEFLNLDQQSRYESDEESLLGVRRSQIQVASYFIQQGEQQLVHDIVEDLAAEPPQRLQRIVDHLKSEDRDLFWEFTARGVNFNYLEPELRPYLDELVGLIDESR